MNYFEDITRRNEHHEMILDKFFFLTDEERQIVIQEFEKRIAVRFCGYWISGDRLKRVIELLKKKTLINGAPICDQIADIIVTPDASGVYIISVACPKRNPGWMHIATVEAPEGVKPQDVLARWMAAEGLSNTSHYKIDYAPLRSWNSVCDCSTTAADEWPTDLFNKPKESES